MNSASFCGNSFSLNNWFKFFKNSSALIPVFKFPFLSNKTCFPSVSNAFSCCSKLAAPSFPRISPRLPCVAAGICLPSACFAASACCMPSPAALVCCIPSSAVLNVCCNSFAISAACCSVPFFITTLPSAVFASSSCAFAPVS